jgi:hypothetical protein
LFTARSLYPVAFRSDGRAFPNPLLAKLGLVIPAFSCSTDFQPRMNLRNDFRNGMNEVYMPPSEVEPVAKYVSDV